MIVDNEILNDPRVMGEARELSRSGIKVVVLCPNYGGFKKEEEKDGVSIIRFSLPKKLRGILFALMNFIPVYVWIWKRQINALIINQKPDLIHAHDLYMIRCASKPAKKHKLPFIADLHENFPAAIKAYEWTKKKPLKYFVNTNYWEVNEGKLLSLPNKVITLSKSFSEYLSKKHQINIGHFIELPNVPDVEMFDSYSIEKKDAMLPTGFVVFYFGVISARRGIITCIEALELLSDLKDIKLLLVGPVDNAEKQDLTQLMNKPLIKNKLVHFAWKDLSELPALVRASSICISPIEKNEQHESGVANKVFQYMLLGSPLIVSDCKPQADLVTTTQSGQVFPSGNSLELSLRIRALYENKEKRDLMAINGRKAIIEHYNLSVYIKELIKTYNELINNE